LDFAFQGALVHMPADSMIHFDDRRHRALPKAGNRAHGKLLVGRGLQDFVAVAGVARILQPKFEFEAHALQQIAGTAGVAGGAATDADGVVPLGLEIKQSVESGDAVTRENGIWVLVAM